MSKNKIDFSQIFGKSRTREEAGEFLSRACVYGDSFEKLSPLVQEKLLQFICGKRGLAITYDVVFRKVFDAEMHPERLERFLSVILGKTIHIKSVLPRDGVQLSEKGSSVIVDITVEDEDGAIIDVEMQKVGYLFPGQRGSCYLSDFILRQYNRMKADKKEKFSYHDMKPVYLVILMENSSENFKIAEPEYLHRDSHVFSSGVKVTTLDHLIYISLDTFRKCVHNVNTELDAWLTFLSCESAEQIVSLVQVYPQFMEYYQDIAQFRTNPKELMNMASSILYEMDRNMEKYMIEQMQARIDETTALVEDQKAEIAKMEVTIEDLRQQLAQYQS